MGITKCAWEDVDHANNGVTQRLKVPDGWLYYLSITDYQISHMEFVPEPSKCRLCDSYHVLICGSCNDITPKEIKPLPETYYDDH